MEKHPDHTASFENLKELYVVKVADTVILETRNAIMLNEVTPRGKLPPALYFPIADVRKEFLLSTEHHTSCPLKGEASYYSIQVDGETLENAVWYYPAPLEHVKEIANYLAFYLDKVEIIKES